MNFNIHKKVKVQLILLLALMLTFTAAFALVSADTTPATYYVDECASTATTAERTGINGVGLVNTDIGNVGDDSRIVRSGTGETYLQYAVKPEQNTIRVTVYENMLSGEVRPDYDKDSSGSSSNGAKQIDNLFFWVHKTSWDHIDISEVSVAMSKGAYGVRWSIITLTYTLSSDITDLRVWLSNGINDNNYQIGKVELYDSATYTPEALPPDAEPVEVQPATYYIDECISVDNSGQRTDIAGVELVNTDEGNVGDNSRIVRSGTGESYLQYAGELGQNTIRITIYENVLAEGLRPEYDKDSSGSSQEGARQVDNLFFWINVEHIDVSDVDIQVSKGMHNGRWSIIALTYTHSLDITSARVWLSNGITDTNYQIGKVELYGSADHTPAPLPPDADSGGESAYYVDECIAVENSGQRTDITGVGLVNTDEGNVGDSNRIVRSGTGESYLQYAGESGQNTVRVTIYEKMLPGEMRPAYAADNGWYSQEGAKQIDNIIFWINVEHIDVSDVNIQISKGAHNVRWSIITLTYTHSSDITSARVWLSNGITDTNYQIGKVELYNSANYTPAELPPDAEPDGESAYYADECIAVENSGQRTDITGVGLVNTDEGNIGDNSRIVRSGTGESYLQYAGESGQNTVRVTIYEKMLPGEVRPAYATDNGWYSQEGAKQVDNIIFWINVDHIEVSDVNIQISKGAHNVRWSIITLTYTHSSDITSARVWLSNGITDTNYQIGKIELYNSANYTPAPLPPDAEPLTDPAYYIDDFFMTPEQNGQRLSGWSAAGFDTQDAYRVGDSSRVYKNGTAESYTVHGLINQDTIRVTVYEPVLEGGARPSVTPIKFSIYDGSTWTKWEDLGVESVIESGRYNYPQRWARYTITYTLSEPIENGMVRVVLGSDQYQIGRLEIFNSGYFTEEPYTPSSPSDGKDFIFSGWISLPDIGNGTVKDSIEFERQIVQMYESGINTILPSIWGWEGLSEEALLSYNLRLLDVGNKYGMKSYVYHPALVDALKANDSAAANNLMAPYKNHPAFLGVFVMDEPTIEQLAEFKTASALFKQFLPNKTFYINLFPYETYNANYGNYVDAYFENISGTQFLSVDYYVLKDTYDNPSMKANYLRNLQILAQKAAERNADLHTILLTMGHTNEGVVLRHPGSTADLTFQAYAALAYGSRGITWFTYGPSWGNPAMLDENGQKTEVYDMALESAQHIQFFSEEFLKYSWTGTILKEGTTGGTNPSFTAVDGAITSHPMISQISSSQDVILGTFRDAANNYAFLLANYTDPAYNTTANVTLKFNINPAEYIITAYIAGVKYDVTFDEDGQYVSVPAGGGVFITLTATTEGVRQYFKEQLSEYASQKITDVTYTVNGKELINSIVEDAYTLFDELNEKADMQQAYDLAKLEIDGVNDAAAELALFRQQVIDNITDAQNLLTSLDYSAKNWIVIAGNFSSLLQQANDAADFEELEAVNESIDGAYEDVLTLLEEFEEYKTNTAEQARQYVQALGEDNYESEQWAEIEGILEETLISITDAKNEEDVEAAIEGGQQAIALVKDIAALFNEYKIQKIDETDTAYNAVTETDYTASGWTAIQSALSAAKTAINDAQDKAEVDAAVAAFILQIETAGKPVPTQSIEQPTENPPVSSCKSSVLSAFSVIAALAFSVLVMFYVQGRRQRG